MPQEPSPAVPPAQQWSHQLPEEAFALYLTMEQGWPTVFSLSHPTPLKIGIDVDILAALSCDPVRLGQVLRWYTRRIAYWQAMATGGERRGLDGQPAGPVSDEHRLAAQPGQRSGRTTTASQPLWPHILQHTAPALIAMSATLKFVLREPPAFRENAGVLYTALTNAPQGVPANLALGETPVYLAVQKKAWTHATKRAADLQQPGRPALYIVEAHVAAREGALTAVAKGIQVVEGKPPAETAAAQAEAPQ